MTTSKEKTMQTSVNARFGLPRSKLLRLRVGPQVLGQFFALYVQNMRLLNVG